MGVEEAWEGEEEKTEEEDGRHGVKKEGKYKVDLHANDNIDVHKWTGGMKRSHSSLTHIKGGYVCFTCYSSSGR